MGINWCKKMLSKKGDQVNQLFRVPATDNVEGLKFQGVLGKMAALLQKTEGLADKWLPALPKGAQTVPLESEYDDSYLLPRMFLLAVSVQTRLVHATQTKCEITMQAAKMKYFLVKGDTTAKMTYYQTKTKQYKQACEVACKGLTFSVQTCEKVIGKEKTKALIQAVEARIPTAWKAASPPAPTKKVN